MAQDAEAVTAPGIPPPAEAFVVRSFWRTLDPWRRRPLGVLGGLVITAVIVIAALAPLIAPNDSQKFVGRPLEHPSSRFLLGTNNLGQDVFSRTIYGAQISVVVGFSASVFAVGLGSMLGLISGYIGGWVDLIIQRALEVLASFPSLILALIFISAVGAPRVSSHNIFVMVWQLRSLEFAIALGLIFGNMRILRSAVIRERGMAYLEAAESIGCSRFRLMWRHILPNVMPYVIVAFTTIIGFVILIEASLSFLGVGAPIGSASWGVDLSSRNREFFLQAPWLIIGPAVGLSLTVLSCNFLGDALRDILDPRLRGSR